ncbi:S1C family serine protease [Kineococcus gynurae]|uniref:S1C family serine protease n=1 Tax=Kineococcus gynurae TaxID=452979 RepID=A0ABV5LN85_9ACTN
MTDHRPTEPYGSDDRPAPASPWWTPEGERTPAPPDDPWGRPGGEPRPAVDAYGYPPPQSGHPPPHPNGSSDDGPWQPGRRRRGGAARLVAAGSAVLLIGIVGGFAGSALHEEMNSGGYAGVSLPAPSAGTVDRPAGSIAGIAAAALPSVVALQVETEDGAGTGSGFVLEADGADAAFVLTNNHVISGARTGGITVLFDDGVQLPAEVVGADASYDLAVVRVGRSGLSALPFGDSGSLVVGDQVVAVGAPLGLQGTVTTGIVSALNRPVTAGRNTNEASYIQAIQTDAAINPGNSGGPLLNTSGEVVGVNSAIAALPGAFEAGGSIGLGFSIPSEQARRTAEQLIRTGRAVHPVIGVSLDPGYAGEGVRILQSAAADGSPPVQPGGPADEAGLRAGDVILAIDGRAVTEAAELIVDIRARQPGDTVTLTVRRGSGTDEVPVTLAADG